MMTKIESEYALQQSMLCFTAYQEKTQRQFRQFAQRHFRQQPQLDKTKKRRFIILPCHWSCKKKIYVRYVDRFQTVFLCVRNNVLPLLQLEQVIYIYIIYINDNDGDEVALRTDADNSFDNHLSVMPHIKSH